ncbi:MAG: ATP-dependent DNA helicase [Pseudomonadota bacterium]
MPAAPAADSAPSVTPLWTVAVRTLCEFTARHGDLDRRFAPTPSGEEGVRGHATVVARRSASYRREVALQGRHGALQVRGRADGWDEALGRLEEIKTFRGRLDTQPANQRAVHWAQLKVYGALMCAQRGLAAVELALVYFDIDRGEETVFVERHPADVLQTFFEAQCEAFLAWAVQEAAHRARRAAWLAGCAFPMAGFRPGQRELAEAVWHTVRQRRVLLAQAPTGIGKTLAVLYPLLKAMPPRGAHRGLDQVLYLTAKTPGRAVALDALRRLQPAPGTAADGAAPLRVIELVARDTACEHPGHACHGADCPLAHGFWDRLPAARAAAVAGPSGVLDRDALRAVALAHAVCPYHLAQDLARWADVLVGDYNHWFDSGAAQHARVVEDELRVAVAVDEAHNLVERARAMYSASLPDAELRAVRRALPAAWAAPLRRLERRLQRLTPDVPAGYEAFDALPEGLTDAAREAAAALTLAQLESAPASPASAPAGEAQAPMFAEESDPARPSPAEAAERLRTLGFELGHFLRLAERFGPHAMFDVQREAAAPPGAPARVWHTLRNLVPAPHLASRWSAAEATVLFSATLGPVQWQADLLGVPAERRADIDLPSPFAAAQLRVQVARHLSTRWRHRQASLPGLVAVMAAQYHAAPGNYLAFFSSHDYLQQAQAAFCNAHPHVPVWAQSRAMGERERQDFLARFVEGGQGIGFAVLGGAFGEGVDLAGTRLVGAFIATLGLPQISPVLEAMRVRLDAQFAGCGDDYVYLYPGLQKVVQAAGRVIRSEQDRGVVLLLDDRFALPRVRALLPAWWPAATPWPVPRVARAQPEGGAVAFMPR